MKSLKIFLEMKKRIQIRRINSDSLKRNQLTDAPCHVASVDDHPLLLGEGLSRCLDASLPRAKDVLVHHGPTAWVWKISKDI